MKVKVYKVYPINHPDLWYYVDAPSMRIAKWCGANIINVNVMITPLTAKDVVAERCKDMED